MVTTKSKAHVIHFGCRLNQYESDSITNGLIDQQITIDKEVENCQYVVINTCTVTNRADAKNRAAIRKVNRLNPSTKIIVTGCYATTDKDQISSLPGVYWVLSNSEKSNIPLLVKNEIENKTNSNLISKPNRQESVFDYQRKVVPSSARAYLKIQDGCNKTCSYCKIPHARGSGVSRPLEETIAEAKFLIENNFHEIVLTGVNMGWYKDPSGYTLYDLIEEILNLPGDFKVRLSSIEPGDVNQRLAELYTHKKMAKFLHVPIQSCSKTVLKRMRRGYTPKHFINWISLVRQKVPDIHLGTDIIVGFPSESEEEFQETYNFCKEIKFANIHIFPYSKRKDTPVMEQLKSENLVEINGTVIKERISRLIELKEELSQNYVKETHENWYSAILINKTNNEKNSFLTENYLRLSVDKTHFSAKNGTMVQVKYDNESQLTEIKHLNENIKIS